MKLFRSTYWVVTYAVAMVAGTVTAQAQDAAPTPAEAPAEIAAPVAEPAPAPPEPVAAPEAVTTMEPMSEKDQAAEEDHEMAEGGLAISMFADSYYNMDWNLPNRDNPTLNYNGNRLHTGYVNDNGFGLGFLGLDASYSSGTVGATASLRFGSGANRLIGQGGNIGLENIWQAYVTWAPTDALTLDMGQFATLYGAEVGESWLNLNYTRGALYYAFQPFWHTGLRAAYAVNDQITLKAILTNGVNNGLNTDQVYGQSSRGPDIGLQFAYAGESVSAYVGYYGSPIESDGSSWAHFADLVVVGAFGDATIIFNGDVGVADPVGVDDMGDDLDNNIYYGVSLAGGYALTETFGIALRGEYLGAPEELGTEFGKSLITATLTLDYKPTDNIVIRLDNRLEAADNKIFANSDSTVVTMTDPLTMEESSSLMDGTGTYISTTLGVVVHTN